MTAYKAPCPHGRYEPHDEMGRTRDAEWASCPGGSLLPSDSLPSTRELIDELVQRAELSSSSEGKEFVHWEFDFILDALAAAQPGTETISRRVLNREAE